MANYTKAIAVPLSDRPYCIGKAELAGFLGVPDSRALERNFLSQGLHWDYRIRPDDSKGRGIEYYMKDSVLKWIADHSDRWTEGTYLRERLERKAKTCKKKL